MDKTDFTVEEIADNDYHDVENEDMLAILNTILSIEVTFLVETKMDTLPHHEGVHRVIKGRANSRNKYNWGDLNNFL